MLDLRLPLVLLSAAVCVAAIAFAAKPGPPSWQNHPVLRADPSMKVPILAWYTTRSDPTYTYDISGKGLYSRQASRFNLIADDVRDTPAATKYQKFDLLSLASLGASVDNFFEFETTREAQVCLILEIQDPLNTQGRNTVMRVPGWVSVGMAQWEADAPVPTNHELSGFHSGPIMWGYLACKTFSAGVHQVPSADRFGAQYNVRKYGALFGEADGSVPPLSPPPSGWTGPAIVEHKLCPEALHEMWVVDGNDANDPELNGMKFRTWHPSHDFIYGCYMGHEHGSPGSLMGYTELYHYTALKNNHQNESHEGFKGYVLKIPGTDKYMYVNIHANTKQMSRVNEPTHTMVVAITSTTGDLEYEMSCKAFFGGSEADYRVYPQEGVPYLPIGTPETQKLITDMYPNGRNSVEKMARKRINLYNENHPDERLMYEEPNRRVGRYEGWNGGGGDEICMTPGNPSSANGISIDIKDPHTGCVDQACTEKVVLGLPNTPAIYPNLGMNRDITFEDITFGPNECNFDIPSRGADGVFYTDQFCRTVLDGPGKNSVRQIIKPSFTSVTINDNFAISDVHGREYYQVGRPGGVRDFESTIKGLRGFRQYEGAIGIGVYDTFA
jgi:hypothetical protein